VRSSTAARAAGPPKKIGSLIDYSIPRRKDWKVVAYQQKRKPGWWISASVQKGRGEEEDGAEERGHGRCAAAAGGRRAAGSGSGGARRSRGGGGCDRGTNGTDCAGQSLDSGGPPPNKQRPRIYRGPLGMSTIPDLRFIPNPPIPVPVPASKSPTANTGPRSLAAAQAQPPRTRAREATAMVRPYAMKGRKTKRRLDEAEELQPPPEEVKEEDMAAEGLPVVPRAVDGKR
jgi:hypothetical protein